MVFFWLSWLLFYEPIDIISHDLRQEEFLEASESTRLISNCERGTGLILHDFGRTGTSDGSNILVQLFFI